MGYCKHTSDAVHNSKLKKQHIYEKGQRKVTKKNYFIIRGSGYTTAAW